MKHTRHPRQQGVSLIECVAALGIVGGTLHLALPAMQETVQSARLSAAAQDLLDDLQLARIEAIKRNRRVALCKSADRVQCNDDGGWDQGWLVFHDENNNGRADAGEEVIRRHEPLARDLRARGNQTVDDYISYTPLGATRSRAGAFQAGTLTVCRPSLASSVSRQVIINAVGRPRTQRTTVPSCPA
jgi:type IV fimbrial biogenesis protein FimT